MRDIGWDREFAQSIVDKITTGCRVTIVNRFGQESTGRATMHSGGIGQPRGWVLNMGGRHGTPGIVTADNFVKCPKVWRDKKLVGHPCVTRR